MSNRRQLKYLLTKALLNKAILQNTFALILHYILWCKPKLPSPSVTFSSVFIGKSEVIVKWAWISA